MCSFVLFFFSSRRRHTRCLSDWSSDVCSSDLDLAVAVRFVGREIEVDDPPRDLKVVDQDPAPGTLKRPGTVVTLTLGPIVPVRSEEHTSELQSLRHLVCRLLLEKKNNTTSSTT